ncbi:hypothetical protein KIW84_024414 [Lathyrus oleraceus]|uniref:Retrovirus-related Pol polyprotein from transposon TNT 1-94 n=1 Tax=Pisum sativum TaxID=3888 RepID=A0A9D4YGG6_PEA|nr:hypothetical protein KIW84_024414 [Pisum sativum]
MHRDQIELILEALPSEFDSVVAAVNSKSEFISLDELESLLITQEARVEKPKKYVNKVIIVNLTQGGLQLANSNYQNPDFNGGNFLSFGHGNNFRGKGLSFGSHVSISSIYLNPPTQVLISPAPVSMSLSSSQSISTRVSPTSSQVAHSQPSYSSLDLLEPNT